VTDQELPERLATICHSKGIEVVEAMPKGADIDDAPADAHDAAPEAAPVVRLR
jgi:DeoR family glycerol-3-phosphate regulon repressor